MKNKKVVEKEEFRLSENSAKVLSTIVLSTLFVGPIVGMTSCVACVVTESSRYFKYKQSDGEYVATGTITYEKLEKCYFVQIENVTLKTNEFYICRKDLYQSGNYDYINILNDKKVIYVNQQNSENEDNTRKIVNEINVSDYLYGLDEIKAEYTPDDVRNLLETIKENTLEENKTMVKMKINTKDIVKL